MATRRAEDGRLEGYVVAFDDVTDLVSAQRMAAWGDVARRIGGQRAERVEDRVEGVGPGPASWQPQRWLAGAVDEAAGQGETLAAEIGAPESDARTLRKLDADIKLQVDAFPVIVCALCVERWWKQWGKDGAKPAAKMAFNTFALAVVIEFVMVSDFAMALIDWSPLLMPAYVHVNCSAGSSRHGNVTTPPTASSQTRR